VISRASCLRIVDNYQATPQSLIQTVRRRLSVYDKL